MEKLPNRQVKTFTDLNETEGEVFRYLSLIDHRDKLLEELRMTNKALKDMRKKPYLMNTIGLINRLQKKRMEQDGDDSGEDGKPEEVENEEAPRSDSKKRAISEVPGAVSNLSSEIPRKEQSTKKAKTGKSAKDRILLRINQKERKVSDKDAAKTEVQPNKK